MSSIDPLAKESHVALLAPVPEEHLISGRQACAEHGRVAFGSRDFEVFRLLDSLVAGGGCDVLFYASWAARPLPGPAMVTWRGRYRLHVEARPDGSPPQGIVRPSTTEKYPGDNKGHWAVYWEVSDIEQLTKDERIPISLLRGINSSKNYLKTFVPERPLIIEAL